MSEYTPDTTTVKECFIEGAEGEYIGVDFDAWLAEVRATALEEAADEFAARLPDGTGNGRAYNSHQVAHMLRTRAARIREEGKA